MSVMEVGRRHRSDLLSVSEKMDILWKGSRMVQNNSSNFIIPGSCCPGDVSYDVTLDNTNTGTAGRGNRYSSIMRNCNRSSSCGKKVGFRQSCEELVAGLSVPTGVRMDMRHVTLAATLGWNIQLKETLTTFRQQVGATLVLVGFRYTFLYDPV